MIKLLKIISKHIVRQCAACGKNTRAIVYSDGKCRGGHYFGKLPLYTDKELDLAHKASTHAVYAQWLATQS